MRAKRRIPRLYHPPGDWSPVPARAGAARSGRRQSAVRAGLVNDAREVLRQELEGGVGRNPEMLGQLLDLIAAERGAKLIRRNRQIAAPAEPRLNLIAEAALLQLRGEALQVTEVRLRQHRRDESRHR